jgi:tetratricopeptide (TPR) repeat protein
VKGAATLALCAGLAWGLAWIPDGILFAQPATSGLAGVNAALQAGEADRALSVLSDLTTAEAGTAQAHNLHCRVFLTLEEWEQAVNECQQAVQLDSQISENHMWLARALGERADRISFMSAYGMAKRAREEFEQAVQLNPRNAAALADLGEFYSSAPGIVGGGMDKANGVAAQLDHVDRARAHELRARIAEGNKDFATAESEFRLAIKASPQPAFQWMTLGSFLRRRQRWSEMETAVQTGYNLAQRDRRSAVALYNGATVLIRAGRGPNSNPAPNPDLALAAKMLDAYLASPLKTEEAPAFVAHTARARLAAQLGDKTTAQHERGTALALAAEYKPARDLKF